MNSADGVQAVMDSIFDRKEGLAQVFAGISREEIRPLVAKLTKEAQERLDRLDQDVKDYLLRRAGEREVIKEEIAWLRRQFELGIEPGPWNSNR
jgi:hypothetical protein